jgi:5-methyltetrahydrofolate--homocysteine methyltransferase
MRLQKSGTSKLESHCVEELMQTTLEEIYNAVIAGKREDTSEKVQQAITENLPPGDILKKALIAAMTEVGDRFEQGEFYVPEMLVAARAMQSGMTILKPLLVEADLQPAGRVVIGTVKGDLHDIGKNLVGMMLEGAGFEIVDLGSDVPPEKFAAAVRENSPDIVGMSALLTTTMPAMENILEALEDLGVRSDVKVIIGGAPVTDSYAEKIGADGFAPDASRAVKLAQALMDRS